ncbi:MAG TPA: hypothetical protein DIC52_02930 [Candidatus Latescibacteria bacterium]|nr:hypothetical protein [Candidatus Latescibacterota bacterium]
MIEETRHAHPHIDPRRPRPGVREETNPPLFAWKPEATDGPFVLEISRSSSFTDSPLRVTGLDDPIYLPEVALDAGAWFWRWGAGGDWSEIFAFEISQEAVRIEIPLASKWIPLMPSGHPRLYVTEEGVDAFRSRCTGDLQSGCDALLASARTVLAEPHAIDEPEFLPDRFADFEAFWKIHYPTMWNTRRFVKGAEAMALAYMATGDTALGRAACERMVSISAWDPEGSSYLAHNDEAHMSVIWHGPHACDWVWDLFTDEERGQVIDQYRQRGTITFEHMHDQGLYGITRFDSHAGREIVFLANVAIVFHDHIPEATTWLEWLRPVLCGSWPSWSGNDGGWAQGLSYALPYVQVMTMFASALKRATGIDLYKKPFWKNHARWRYLMLPAYAEWMGFGDHSEKWRASWEMNADVMEVIARETDAPGFMRYVDDLRKESLTLTTPPERHMAGVLSQLFTAPPLPKGDRGGATDGRILHVFSDVGWAAIRTAPEDRDKDVAFIFRSSPYGSISHSHANNNDFILHVGSRVMAMPAGYYAGYGSSHHGHYVWHTKSHNCVTLSDAPQLMRSPESTGEIVNAYEDDAITYMCGIADASYADRADRCRRHVVFAKGVGSFLLVDEFAGKPNVLSSLQWNLHSWEPYEVDERERTFRWRRAESAVTGVVMCHSEGFFSLSEGWDPPPMDAKWSKEWRNQYHLRFTPTLLQLQAKDADSRARHPHGFMPLPGRNLGVVLQTQLPGQTVEPHERSLEKDGRETVSVGDTRFVVIPTGQQEGIVGEVSVGDRRYQFGDEGLVGT